MRTLALSFFLSVIVSSSALAQEIKSFAVVELFTSEGCSSCPPADELFKDITAKADREGLAIYTLGFHVDYWNYLGWRDPFSNSSNTQRQHRYSSFIPGGVYTPEMVINGKEGFVGSDLRQANSALQRALQQRPSNSIQLSVDKGNGDIKVSYKAARKELDSVVVFALVEHEAVSHVTAGENGGRTLEHVNIVRELETVKMDHLSGEVVLSIPRDKALSGFSIIAFIQSTQDMSISAAAKIDL